jgi:hypothetical protein
MRQRKQKKVCAIPTTGSGVMIQNVIKKPKGCKGMQRDAKGCKHEIEGKKNQRDAKGCKGMKT